MDKTAFVSGAVATIGTPDDLVARIKSVLDISGGFGTVVGFVHDWANPENTMRSWDMVARYVVPEINGYLAGLRTSREFVATNREYFNRAREAVMAKITENEAAAAALKVTKSPLLAASSGNVPDLNHEELTQSPAVDLDPVVVEDGAAAHVVVPLGHRGVGVGGAAARWARSARRRSPEACALSASAWMQHDRRRALPPLQPRAVEGPECLGPVRAMIAVQRVASSGLLSCM